MSGERYSELSNLKVTDDSGKLVQHVNVDTIALPTAVFNGKTTVATATTRVVLASSQALITGVHVKANAGNTGLIYVGDSAVAAANGLELEANESAFIEVSNLDVVYIDAASNGEGVTYLAF